MSRRPRVPRVTPASGTAPSSGRTPEPGDSAPAGGTAPTPGPAPEPSPTVQAPAGPEQDGPPEEPTGAGQDDPAARRRARAASIAREPGATVLRLPNRREMQRRGASETQAEANEPTTAADPAPGPARRRRPRRRSGQGRFSRWPEGAAARRRQAARSVETRRQAPPAPVPARALTGRSLLVIAVVLLAAVLVAPTLRVFLNQELEMNAVRADIAEQERQRDEREERIRRWDDPEYVKQQARERLELVRPGETLYTVTGVDELPEQYPETSSVDENPVNERLPWAEGLWDSVVRAGTE